MSEPPSTRSTGSSPLLVHVMDEQGAHTIDARRWIRLVQHALATEGVARGELSVVFVDEDEMAALNRRYMGEEGPTDVLAFPIDDASADEPAELLGDVIVCPAVAARNVAAAERTPHPGFPDHDGSLESEISLLVVHGVLHILGMDHAEEAEAAVMHTHESSILSSFDSGREEDR